MNLLQTVNIRGINVSLEEASEFCWRSLAKELLSISRSLSHLITILAQLFESRLVLTRWLNSTPVSFNSFFQKIFPRIIFSVLFSASKPQIVF